MTEEQEPQKQDSGTASAQSGAKKRKKILIGLAAVLVAGALIYVGYWFFYGRWHVSTDDAYVHGNIVTVTPQVPGTVVSIDTDDTDFVQQGQELVKLDNTDARSALSQAEAALAQTVRQVRGLYANESVLKAQVAARSTALAQARRDYERNKGLRKVNGVSEEIYQHSKTAYRSDVAKLAATRAQLKAARAAVSGTTLRTHPLVLQAEAKVRDAWIALARTRIVAPISGFVANRNVQLGERVQPGQSLLAVIPLDQIWVDANFKETDLATVHIGQPVTVVSDLYGSGVKYKGRVVGLDAGTGGVFALLPPQNASGNWIKVVQRLPVRIALEDAQIKKHPLRLGLSMTATIDTHDRSGPVLARSPATGPGNATPVYGRESSGVNALIQRIVNANASDDGKGTTQ